MKLFLALMLWCTAAFADRIISDSYPVTVAQPSSCRVAYDGSTVFTGYAVLANTDGSVYCSVTIPALAGGNHTAMVKACINTTECSDPPTPFSFTVGVVGVPAEPKNLRRVSP